MSLENLNLVTFLRFSPLRSVLGCAEQVKAEARLARLEGVMLAHVARAFTMGFCCQ